MNAGLRPFAALFQLGGLSMFRRLLICTILLLCLHGLTRAELTLQEMETESGIPALVATYLRAFNAADEDALRAFLSEYRDATSLARTPVETRVSRQLQMHGLIGTLRPVAEATRTETEYELVVSSEKTGAYFLLMFGASELEPIRFGMMGLRPTEAPDQAMVELPGTLSELVPAMRASADVPSLGVAVIDVDGTESVVVDGVRDVRFKIPVQVSDLFHYGSITKSMTASVAARLVDRGEIAFETTIAEALPDLEVHAGFKDVTLEQLLQHRAGVEAMLADAPEREARWRAAGERPAAQRHALVADVLAAAPLFTPGATMDYSNAGYTVAAVMMESVTGSTWEELIATEVFEPLELSSCGIGWPATESRPDQPRGHWPGPRTQEFTGYELGAFLAPAGDVHGSVLDLAHFGHALAAIDEVWIKSATRARLMQLPNATASYSMGFMHEEMAGRSVVLHAGSAGTFFALLVLEPASGRSVAVVMNEGSLANDALARRIATAILDGSVSLSR
jgi:CubicO group peptidase (beta-lactamase class C family)